MSQSGKVMPAVILAGGMATRLGPLTEHTPKALIQLAGRPFLWHQLKLLKRCGIQRVILLVGHLGENIRQRFRDGAELGISIEYSFDGPVPLGTAGQSARHFPYCRRGFSYSMAIPTSLAITRLWRRFFGIAAWPG